LFNVFLSGVWHLPCSTFDPAGSVIAVLLYPGLRPGLKTLDPTGFGLRFKVSGFSFEVFVELHKLFMFFMFSVFRIDSG
jgi:hypothetical protein